MAEAKGIPGLVDITHPEELIDLGTKFLLFAMILLFLAIALGIVIGVLSWGLKKNEIEEIEWLKKLGKNYYDSLGGISHSILITIIVMTGFMLCSTLANRYHNWEQQTIASVEASVAGERLEQRAPTISYLEKEPYSYLTRVRDRLVRIEETREVTRFLAVTSSDINVKIDQITNAQKKSSNNYYLDFTGVYQVNNTLGEEKELLFQISPPYGYLLLQNFRLEREGKVVEPTNPDNYRFPVILAPNKSTSFRVTYQAQGAPRWVYNASGALLSNFNLNIRTTFPNADFASGIAPTSSKIEGDETIFTWTFTENVSVANPFGVFTATAPVKNTGVLPRLLLLSPFILIWWLLLLYLSVSLCHKDVVIASGVFFASLLTLTYVSRMTNSVWAWSIISLVLLILVWGLGTSRRGCLAILISTLSGLVLPVLALLVPYSGLTFSLAGILSVIWVVVLNWYGRV